MLKAAEELKSPIPTGTLGVDLYTNPAALELSEMPLVFALEHRAMRDAFLAVVYQHLREGRVRVSPIPDYKHELCSPVVLDDLGALADEAGAVTLSAALVADLLSGLTIDTARKRYPAAYAKSAGMRDAARTTANKTGTCGAKEFAKLVTGYVKSDLTRTLPRLLYLENRARVKILGIAVEKVLSERHSVKADEKKYPDLVWRLVACLAPHAVGRKFPWHTSDMKQQGAAMCSVFIPRTDAPPMGRGSAMGIHGLLYVIYAAAMDILHAHRVSPHVIDGLVQQFFCLVVAFTSNPSASSHHAGIASDRSLAGHRAYKRAAHNCGALHRDLALAAHNLVVQLSASPRTTDPRIQSFLEMGAHYDLLKSRRTVDPVVDGGSQQWVRCSYTALDCSTFMDELMRANHFEAAKQLHNTKGADAYRYAKVDAHYYAVTCSISRLASPAPGSVIIVGSCHRITTAPFTLVALPPSVAWMYFNLSTIKCMTPRPRSPLAMDAESHGEEFCRMSAAPVLAQMMMATQPEVRVSACNLLAQWITPAGRSLALQDAVTQRTVDTLLADLQHTHQETSMVSTATKTATTHMALGSGVTTTTTETFSEKRQECRVQLTSVKTAVSALAAMVVAPASSSAAEVKVDTSEATAGSYASSVIADQLVHARPTDLHSVRCRPLCQPLAYSNSACLFATVCHVEAASLGVGAVATHILPNSWSLQQRDEVLASRSSPELLAPSSPVTTAVALSASEDAIEEIEEGKGVVGSAPAGACAHNGDICMGSLEFPIGTRKSKKGISYVYPTTDFWVFAMAPCAELRVGKRFMGFVRSSVGLAEQKLRSLCDRFNGTAGSRTRPRAASLAEEPLKRHRSASPPMSASELLSDEEEEEEDFGIS
jgi:hypothetical protein